uniref:Uncharacterized protein n=1 Tax=Oryza barthii TaxID=65489 RepID=A0A0D3HC76_9ORYZ
MLSSLFRTVNPVFVLCSKPPRPVRNNSSLTAASSNPLHRAVGHQHASEFSASHASNLRSVLLHVIERPSRS